MPQIVLEAKETLKLIKELKKVLKKSINSFPIFPQIFKKTLQIEQQINLASEQAVRGTYI